LLQQIEPFIGRFYSDEWVKRNLLRMTDDEIKVMDTQIKDSLQNNIAFAQNKGEQQLAQQKPTMDAQQQLSMQQQVQQNPEQAAKQESKTETAADKKPAGKTKSTGEQKDSFDWSN
jgi:hypothetical protein